MNNLGNPIDDDDIYGPENIGKCVFCGILTEVRKHHIIPKSKEGTVTVDTCEVCESYIHKTWTHSELKYRFNTVKSILENEGFQKFLKWRRKQSSYTIFKSVRGKYRDKNKYH
jgi:hypothetical protein